MRSKLVVAVLALAVVVACDGDSPTAPNPPSPPPAPDPVTYDIQVRVETADGIGIPGATLEVLDGMFAGQTFTVGGSGNVLLTDAEGTMNIEARAPGFANRRLGVGPPAMSGGTQSLTFQLPRRGALWTRSGQGNNVFDMPFFVTRVRIVGRFDGFCQNFIVRIDGDLTVNEILGDCSIAIGNRLEGVHLVSGGGGTVEITGSAGVSWTFTEVRTQQ